MRDPILLDRIAKLWARGKTLDQVAEVLNITKGQTAGLIFRARRGGDKRFSSKEHAHIRKSKDRPMGDNSSTLVTPRKGIPLYELGIKRCKYPIHRDEELDQHLFCGQPTMTVGDAYCPAHEALVRSKPNAKSRVTT